MTNASTTHAMEPYHPSTVRAFALRGGLLLAALALAGCVSNVSAPVQDLSPAAPAAAPGPDDYVVKKGDTLYGIALDHGFGYRELAEWNGIQNPDLILVGQIIHLKPPAGSAGSGAAEGGSVAVATPLDAAQPPNAAPTPSGPPLVTSPKAEKYPYSPELLAKLKKAPEPTPTATPIAAATPTPTPTPTADSDKPAPTGNGNWIWPTNGKVISQFSTASKGIDIAGKLGQPIYAADAGKVVYAGAGLRGYGQLVIIKHDKTYLSAYAHNSKLLVKEGDSVKQGQKIAEMGNSDADRIKLHFEIRRFGTPTDPLKLLPPA